MSNFPYWPPTPPYQSLQDWFRTVTAFFRRPKPPFNVRITLLVLLLCLTGVTGQDLIRKWAMRHNTELGEAYRSYIKAETEYFNAAATFDVGNPNAQVQARERLLHAARTVGQSLEDLREEWRVVEKKVASLP